MLNQRRTHRLAHILTLQYFGCRSSSVFASDFVYPQNFLFCTDVKLRKFYHRFHSMRRYQSDRFRVGGGLGIGERGHGLCEARSRVIPTKLEIDMKDHISTAPRADQAIQSIPLNGIRICELDMIRRGAGRRLRWRCLVDGPH